MTQANATEVWTIGQLTRQIKSLLEDRIGQVWISGEISNWKVAASGHAYFTLKDEQSQIDAVMFRGKAVKTAFEPESGLEVLARGRISVYERRGNYQIVLDDMQPRGMGALQLAFEKLKAKLSAEGLFDEAHKQPLPLLPRRIGVVTSSTGAAIRDILNVLGAPLGNVHVLLYPTRVQGKAAAAEIVAGIQALDAWGVDVMIVGRGGGSLEDLWPFNEEPVVRAVFEAKTPIISAVGHEIDFALTDFAADLRAPTPSAAAELVVQEQQSLIEGLDRSKQRLTRALQATLERARMRARVAGNSYALQRPEELVRQRRQTCDELRMRLEGALNSCVNDTRGRLDRTGHALALLSPQRQVERAIERLQSLRPRLWRATTTQLERLQGQMERLGGRLHALSPLAILSRGYALAWKLPEGQLVRSASELKTGDPVRLRFGTGSARAQIVETEEENHDES